MSAIVAKEKIENWIVGNLYVVSFNGVSDQEVVSYALNLMKQIGATELPAPVIVNGVTRYTFKDVNTGASITLRDFSTSQTSTGAKWAIDINKHPDSISGNGKINKAEIKFK